MAELRAFRLPDDLDWTRAVLWEALQIHDGDGPQQRAFKIALAAWAADQVGILPRQGIAVLLGKSPTWVTHSLQATEKRLKSSAGFRTYCEKIITELKGKV